MPAQSKAVEATENGVVSAAKPFQKMLRAMANDATIDQGEYNGDELNAILEATSEEELFESDNRPPLNFQHLAGCEIAILDVHVKYSRGGNDEIQTPFVSPDGKQMYLLVNAVRLSTASDKGNLIKLPDVGEEFQANTSARYLVAKIWRAYTLGLIDPDKGKQWECAVEETDLGGNQAVLKLRPIPKRSVSA